MNINSSVKKSFEKQGYRFVGKHSAIKISNWVRESLRDKEVCYKEKFYGIKSHRCVQMSCTLLNCQNKCLHCWRDITCTDNRVIIKPDKPKKIIDDCIKQQQKILQCFKGSKKTNLKKFSEAMQPTQFAISLTGEATLYPFLPELIKELRKRKMNSFLVSNGLLPEKLKELRKKNALPTQLYLSLLYPNEKIFRKITNNKEKNAWKKFNESLGVMKDLSKFTRTVLRITLIKGINNFNLEEYSSLIKKAMPQFVEIKSYMAIGHSRVRLGYNQMLSFKEIMAFSRKLSYILGYSLKDYSEVSRVVLLVRNKSVKRFIS